MTKQIWKPNSDLKPVLPVALLAFVTQEKNTLKGVKLNQPWFCFLQKVFSGDKVYIQPCTHLQVLICVINFDIGQNYRIRVGPKGNETYLLLSSMLIIEQLITLGD